MQIESGVGLKIPTVSVILFKYTNCCSTKIESTCQIRMLSERKFFVKLRDYVREQSLGLVMKVTNEKYLYVLITLLL